MRDMFDRQMSSRRVPGSHRKEIWMKKFISAMMIVVLLAGSLGGAAFAEDTERVKTREAKEEVRDKPPEKNELPAADSSEITEPYSEKATKNAVDDAQAKQKPEEADTEVKGNGHSEADDTRDVEVRLKETKAEEESDAEEALSNPEKPVMVLAMNEGTPPQTRAATENVTLRVGERVSYGNWSTNYFYINDQLAYCLEPKKGTPSSGDYIAEVLDNKQLTKGMYYLMGGPGFTPEIREAFFSSAAGFTEKQIYAFCHAILSFIYSGYNINSDAFLGLNKDEKDGIQIISYQIRDRLPAPPDGSVSITPGEQYAYWDSTSGKQWTDAYQVKGDAGNILKFTLPSGVRIHNLITGSVGTGTVSVKGGDSFRLEGDAALNGRWESGKLSGSIQETYMSFVIRSPGDKQDVGGLSYHKEPLITAEFAVEWMSRGIIRVRKVCTQTNEVLEGAEFEVCARDDIVRNGEIIAKAGEIMASVVTDRSGTGSTPVLPAEAYYVVRETKAPIGYAVSAEAAQGIEVYLTAADAVLESGIPLVFIEVDNALMNCDFTIHKVIRAADIVWAHGNPTFLFQVAGKDLDGNYHMYARTVEFTEKYVEGHTDRTGNVRMSTVFENIACGRAYSVTELNVNRYVLADVQSADANIKIRRLQSSVYGKMPEALFEVTADLYAKPYGSSVTFRNDKIRWDDWSHNAVIVNRVERK